MDKEGNIDFKKLERELEAAVQADAKYQRENDAKFRAIEQKVASYEEFKDIVAASHLKPLDREDISGIRARKQPWNTCANVTTDPSTEPTHNSEQKAPLALPQNNIEFNKNWTRHCTTSGQRYQLLLRVGGERIGKLFKTEVNLLGDILKVLNENHSVEYTNEIISILDNLSNAKRFTLSVQFLSSEEKEAAKDIFDKLSESRKEMQVDDDDCSLEKLNKVARKYGLPDV